MDNTHDNAFDKIAWAKSYPFDVPQRSYIYSRGRAHSLVSYSVNGLVDASVEDNGQEVRVTNVLTASQIRSLEMDHRHAVLACGSNASPSRLAQKFSGKFYNAVIPVIAVELEDHCIVHAANITVYGSVPATYSKLKKARVKTFVTFLTEEQLEVMDQSEQLGLEYDRPDFSPDKVKLETDEKIGEVSGYINRHGALLVEGDPTALASVQSENVHYKHLNQIEAQSAVMKALGVSHAMEHYIAQNIDDHGLRNARAAELRDLHGKPFHD